MGLNLKSIASDALEYGTLFGGQIVGADKDAKAVADANQKNYANVKEANEWTERMSNTAYQRVMEDMRKANLNPMLAFSQGGASTPQMQAATEQVVPKGERSRQVSKALSETASTAMQAKSFSNQQQAHSSMMDLQSSQSQQQTSQAKLNQQSVVTAQTQAKLNNANAKKSAVEALESEARTKTNLDRNDREAEGWHYDKQVKKVNAEWAETEKQIDNATGVLNTISGFIPGTGGRYSGPYRGQTDFPTGNTGSRHSGYGSPTSTGSGNSARTQNSNYKVNKGKDVRSTSFKIED